MRGAILKNLQDSQCGVTAYIYVRDFLSSRTATVGLGKLRSDKLQVPKKGTPPGSVILPLVFIIAMINLPGKLNTIPGLRHAICADDLKLLKGRGSTGNQHGSLQEAVDRTEAYLKQYEPSLASEKSELLVLRERQADTRPKHPTRR
ncbi:hypothetical protein HPB48_025296 [Haemaphysalis longicornis]|uniref:Reverse transcriptase domain-containing protein n=1 Tax=Haemaphysalis longicornis TaxID=44386 RepID=A0A9J6H7C0_HAELO|nr:hypothetical protein HPB48_025296 [Haemaphysalis longicornis]